LRPGIANDAAYNPFETEKKQPNFSEGDPTARQDQGRRLEKLFGIFKRRGERRFSSNPGRTQTGKWRH
jgi:hypothetical protein